MLAAIGAAAMPLVVISAAKAAPESIANAGWCKMLA